ncbi:hypothetical protein SKAU_G00342400 [Synaphobranchus kaupii]|uniref:Uncharacterized protein n=1 Tax=Synaphobranchus kaupii TaxID=118154 RepID=A0A9Q1ENC7_SYNKA|nr:hypothetical protein SKAU_G00342400 [Synaphobranchus kaupii]
MPETVAEQRTWRRCRPIKPLDAVSASVPDQQRTTDIAGSLLLDFLERTGSTEDLDHYAGCSVIKDKVTEVLLEQQVLPVGADTGDSVLDKAESSPVKTECPVTAAQQKFELDMKRLELEAQTALREKELEA